MRKWYLSLHAITQGPMNGHLTGTRVPQQWAEVVLIGFILLLAPSCTSADPQDDGHTSALKTDDAGVVENITVVQLRGEAWRVAETPELVIGAVEGDPKYQFFRVAGATRLPNGGIAVANAGTSDVRIFDQHGRYVVGTKGDGDGPGEFRALRQFWPYRGDSLIAWDLRHRRATILGPDGRVGRQFQVDAARANAKMLRPFSDGSFLLQNEPIEFSGSGVTEQTLELTLHGEDGTLRGFLGTFPAFTTITIRTGASPFIGSPRFSPTTSVAVSDSLVYIGRARTPEIEVRDRYGKFVRWIRWPDSDRTVAARDVRASKTAELEAFDDDEVRRQRRAIQDKIPSAKQFPAFGRILADRVGRLWVERFRRPGDPDGRRWMVIDGEGRTHRELTTPARFNPMEIGRDYILGVTRDELGVESIRMYRIEM